jgi:hypothetical protein
VLPKKESNEDKSALLTSAPHLSFAPDISLYSLCLSISPYICQSAHAQEGQDIEGSLAIFIVSSGLNL